MLNEIIFVVEESSEGGYEVRALGYPIFTEADTLENFSKGETGSTLGSEPASQDGQGAGEGKLGGQCKEVGDG